ncbi:MAG TPA: hypothetical protein DCP92_14625 [Nitrospiraceae bacterium]|jgi:hypothetical protein|nr:hypothetical protein [Nitrospiraceae bacterium]
MRKRKQSKFGGNDLEVRRINFEAFFDELKKRVYTNAIATIASPEGVLTFDIRRNESGKPVFGYSLEESAILHARLYRLLSNYNKISLILRSFTERRHVQSGLPIKELRAYTMWLGGNKTLLFEKASKAALFVVCNTDAGTGEPLTPEIAVEYCDDSLSEDVDLGQTDNF